jgi:hypothetical protein
MKDKLLKSFQIIVISLRLLWHKIRLFLEMLKFSKNCLFQRIFFLKRKMKNLLKYSVFQIGNFKIYLIIQHTCVEVANEVVQNEGTFVISLSMWRVIFEFTI